MIEPDLGAAALLSLVIIAALSALAALAVFRKFTDAEALRRATNRIVAHLLECFLYLAEPRLVFRAQGDLILANLRFLRIIALPLAILILPFWFLFAQLEANFGQAPLPLGVPSVLTLHLAGETPTAELKAPPEIAIETPAVRDLFDKEINWRIRPLRPTSGPVRITRSGRVLQASVRAGHRIVATVVNPFSRSEIDRHYPRATVLNHDWVTWYIAASALTALLWWRYAS